MLPVSSAISSTVTAAATEAFVAPTLTLRAAMVNGNVLLAWTIGLRFLCYHTSSYQTPTTLFLHA